MIYITSTGPIKVLFMWLLEITIFIQIVAVATINFSLAATNWGQLLFEDGFYFGVILPSAIHKISNVKDWFMRTALQIIEIWLKNKQPRCCRTKPTTSSVLMATPTWLCSCMHAAIIRGRLLIIFFHRAPGASTRINTVCFSFPRISQEGAPTPTSLGHQGSSLVQLSFL